MPITVTLEDDVAVALTRLAKQRGMKPEALVNQFLREGIKRMTTPQKKRNVFRTRAVDLGACGAANVDNVAAVLAVAEDERTR